MDAKLKELGAEFGINLKSSHISFTNTNATIKVEAAVKAANGEVVTKEAQDFKRWAMVFGLKPEWLGKTFKSQDGCNVIIRGLKPKSKKYPVLGYNSYDGKTYKYPAHFVKSRMEGQIPVQSQVNP
jgi:hypothetical protein